MIQPHSPVDTLLVNKKPDDVCTLEESLLDSPNINDLVKTPSTNQRKPPDLPFFLFKSNTDHPVNIGDCTQLAECDATSNIPLHMERTCWLTPHPLPPPPHNTPISSQSQQGLAPRAAHGHLRLHPVRHLQPRSLALSRGARNIRTAITLLR